MSMIFIIKIKCESCSVVSNSVTPWTVTFQLSLHEILQAGILKWVAISSRASSQPRD